MSDPQKIAEITAAVEKAASVPDIVQFSHRPIMQLFAVNALAIYLNDPKNNELFSWFVVGAPFKDVRYKRANDNIIGLVGVTGRVVAVNDVYDPKQLAQVDPSLRFDPKFDVQFNWKTKQSLAAPIMHGNSVMGVVQLLNRAQPIPFSADDLKAVTEVGKILGSGFFNIRNKAAPAPSSAAPGPAASAPAGGASAAASPAVAAQTSASGAVANTAGASANKARHKFSSLVDKGLLTEQKLEQHTQEATRLKKDVALYLAQDQGLPRKEILQSMATHFRVPMFDWDGTQRIPEDLKRLIKPDFLHRYKCAPLYKQAGTLYFVVDDPGDVGRIDMLRSTGMSPQLAVLVGLQDDIAALVDKSYSADANLSDLLKEGAEVGELSEEAPADAGGSEVAESDSTVVKVVNQIMKEAYERGVSDIHIEPQGHEAPVQVRYRKDGDCYLHLELPAAYRKAVSARIKIMAKLDIAERRKPQDGKIRLMLGDKKVELRVATLPTVEDNEDVVMRILAASKPLPLEKMGFSPNNLAGFKKILDMPYGLVLVVGPTGSGKTTTLHSGIGFINTPDRKIWTAEDPVEITQRGLRQVQVNPKIDFTFAMAMRAFLRADPDVIMVGEMRDHETAAIGTEASLTGHLVLSTLHTNSAPETITRLLDMELDPFSFSDALLGVLAQRLVRTLCGQCKESYTPEASEIAEMKASFGNDKRFDEMLASSPAKWARAKGCSACGNSGYKGRMGIHELLLNDDVLKKLIQRKAPVDDIREHAVTHGGMWTLLQDGVQKAFQGSTDFRQVAAVCIK